MEEQDNNIFYRHNTDRGLNIAGALIELEARLKTAYVVIDEMKMVLAGQAEWARMTDLRLKKLEPAIQVFGEEEAKIILKG